MGNKANPPETLIRAAGALIFDLDGTLYDTRGFARRLVLARPGDGLLMLAERGIRKRFAGADYLSAGAYYGEFFFRMSRAAGRSAEGLRNWYFDRYIPLMCGVLKKHYRPRPGAVELFAGLTQRAFPFAVYSDYPRTAERLSSLGLEQALGGKLYGPEDFGAQKPAPRPFLSIARDMGVPPDRTLVIGDRDDTDGAGAAAAGMAYIGITNSKRGASPSVRWETLTALL
ncbi:MAG: HAD family hydrolase, partial [Treponema sp.]|nr:HAD family hydrolase [Treponema sp.]